MAIILKVFPKESYLPGEIKFSFGKYIMIFYLLIILMGFFCQQAYAQDENHKIEKYNQETIYLYSDFWGEGYVKNGRIISLGRFASNLEKEITNSPYAIRQLQKARDYKKIAIITGTTATILGITDIILQLSNTKYSHKRSISIPLIGGGAILGTISKLYDQSYKGAINMAIWLYNRDVIRED